MITAKALVKQLSVLEIPDGCRIVVWRTDNQDYELQCSIAEALGSTGTKGTLITIGLDDDLAALTDEDLDRMGLQRKPCT